VLTFVTPLYLGVVLVWWAITEALPILTLSGGASAGGPITPGTEIYVHPLRLIIVGFIVFFLVMIRIAWKRNRYDDRVGFVEVEGTALGTPEVAR
jgi:ammonia channel protein AmtB